MEPFKVIIETPWYTQWIPILIALLALFISIYSIRLSRKQFIDASRPFVWFAQNFYRLEDGKIQPNIVLWRITNAPAKISYAKYRFYFKSGNEVRDIHNYEENDVVRFPDEKSQHRYNFEKFEQSVMSRKLGEELERYLRVEYSELSENKKYMYESHCKYDFPANLWRIISEKAT